MMDEILKPREKETRKQDIKEAIHAVFDSQNINQRSNLSASQVAGIVALRMFAKRHKSQIADTLADWLLEVKISENARGRGDMREALRAALLSSDEIQDAQLKKRLLGL